MQSVKEIKQQLMCYLDAKWYSKIVKHDHHTELMVCVKQIAKCYYALSHEHGNIVKIKKLASHIPEIFDNTEDENDVHSFVMFIFRDVKDFIETWKVTYKYPCAFGDGYFSFQVNAKSKSGALLTAISKLVSYGYEGIDISNIELSKVV